MFGVDRDSTLIADLFDEANDAVKWAIRHLIDEAHACGRAVGFCGQAPSDDPSFAAFLVDAGIDSVSVDASSFLEVVNVIAYSEAQTMQSGETERPMKYAEILNVASEITHDAEVADAGVKAVLGIIASHVPEHRARELAKTLPAPLTLEKLRGHQRRKPAPSHFEECVTLVANQLALENEAARWLVQRVIHKAVAPDELDKLLTDLPGDWRPALKRAA